MPREHADRLVDALPRAHLALVPDSYTLVPLDQPTLLAGLITRFAHAVRAGEPDLSAVVDQHPVTPPTGTGPPAAHHPPADERNAP